MTVDLVSWLLEQIAERERLANQAHEFGCDSVIWFPGDGEGMGPCDCGLPARVLAECAAKRRIIEHVQTAVTGWIEDQPEPGDIGYDKHDRSETDCAVSDLEHVLRLLATPYDTRPGYRGEWKLIGQR